MNEFWRTFWLVVPFLSGALQLTATVLVIAACLKYLGEDPGPGGKRLLAQIKIRRLYFPVCQDLYSGGLLCRPGPGGSDA